MSGPRPPTALSGYRKPLGLRVQILVGLGVVTGFAMLSTGYLALWAAGQSVISQREGTARAVAEAGVNMQAVYLATNNRAVAVTDDNAKALAALGM